MFDPARAQVVGRRTRRVIKLGSRVIVQVRKVDGFKKQVDFELVKAGFAVAAGPPLQVRILEGQRAGRI